MIIALTLHALSAAIWVGGMFFAYVALRPVAATLLEPSLRLPLWSRTFGRFFPWVWVAIVLLLATGYWMIFAVFGGMARIGMHVHLMQGIGIVMMLLFVYLYFRLYRNGLNRALANDNLKEAGAYLTRIRHVIAVNLALGLIVIATGSGGRFW